MSAVKVKAGDRVRVVLEGEVRKHPLSSGTFVLGNAGNANYVIPDAAHVVSVEVLKPAVTVFKPGDTVRSPGGNFYTVGKNGYYDHTAKRVWADDPPLEFTSEGYVKVELAEVPF